MTGKAIPDHPPCPMTTVMPPPGTDPADQRFATPLGASVIDVARPSVDGAPYRTGAGVQEVLIRLGTKSSWRVSIVMGCLLATGAAGLLVRLSRHQLGLDAALWLGMIGLAGLVLGFRKRDPRITVDRDVLRVLGVPAAKRVVPLSEVVALESFHRQLHAAQPGWYGVHVKTRDGARVPIASMPTLVECWWVEQTVRDQIARITGRRLD